MDQPETTMANTSPVKLLWTGGWDSSFRLMQLTLVEGRPVQPIYLLSPGRSSTVQEIRAMDTIREGVTARLREPGLLAPTEVHVWSHYPPGPRLQSLFDSIEARQHIGIQYLHLAAVAEARGWNGVEIGVLQADRWGPLDEPPLAELFRYWSFPLFNMEKEEMREVARQHGFLDLLLQRWFCHRPLRGKPCGMCRPCLAANRDGIAFANPALAGARRAWRDPRVRARVLGLRARLLSGSPSNQRAS
jgi:7-cyano-7-deazaguanine synthase